ncbi:MAG: glycosyl hydrolase family 28-related protein [Nostocales cyanobacterium ELA583]|jgi:parallel beta-helix repeat protein
MKINISNACIKLTLLTSLYLVTLGVLYKRNLTAITTHTQKMPQFPELKNYQTTIHLNQSAGTQSSLNLPEIKKTEISLSNKFTKLREVISVKEFGAVGNGMADDTKAIQAAIDATSKAGGGTVFFPSGIYKISINRSKLYAITIRGKIILQGASNKESVIKLAPKQGNYDAILAGEYPDSDLSNFAMYDLTIDGNGLLNPIAAESNLSEKNMRYSVRIYRGSKINIERSRFINQNNVNVITTNGEYVKNIAIKNNIFDLIGGGNIDYDHSTIYTHGERIEITNNYFSSRHGADTNGARTAIEIHGNEHIVKNNVITGFTNGINITGIAHTSNNQVITNNLIKEAHSGIIIWSYFSHGNTTNPALSNCTISSNKINLNIDGWRKLWGDSPGAGIQLEPNSDAPMNNLNIIDNEISFGKLLKNGHYSDNLANGIRFWRSKFPNIKSENIRIIGNKIENSLAGGIYLFMPINNGEISNNTIINSGKSNSKFHDDYRAGISVSGDLFEFQINNNLLIDNQAKNTLRWGIISFANCINKCQAKGNSLKVSSDAKLKIFEFKSNKNNFEI